MSNGHRQDFDLFLLFLQFFDARQHIPNGLRGQPSVDKRAIVVMLLLNVTGSVADLLPHSAMLNEATRPRDMRGAQSVNRPVCEALFDLRFQEFGQRQDCGLAARPKRLLRLVCRWRTGKAREPAVVNRQGHFQRRCELRVRVTVGPTQLDKGQRRRPFERIAQITAVKTSTFAGHEQRFFRRRSATHEEVPLEINNKRRRDRCGSIALLAATRRQRNPLFVEVTDVRLSHSSRPVTRQQQRLERNRERIRTPIQRVEFIGRLDDRTNFFRRKRALVRRGIILPFQFLQITQRVVRNDVVLGSPSRKLLQRLQDALVDVGFSPVHRQSRAFRSQRPTPGELTGDGNTEQIERQELAQRSQPLLTLNDTRRQETFDQFDIRELPAAFVRDVVLAPAARRKKRLHRIFRVETLRKPKRLFDTLPRQRVDVAPAKTNASSLLRYDTLKFHPSSPFLRGSINHGDSGIPSRLAAALKAANSRCDSFTAITVVFASGPLGFGPGFCFFLFIQSKISQ
ncbi:MAG: hypothetical protein WCT04_12430 [Planctomycetota bacterium]